MSFDILEVFSLGTVYVPGDIQIEFICFNLCKRNHTRIAFVFYPAVEDVHDLSDVLLTETVLVAVFHKAPAGVDHEDALS